MTEAEPHVIEFAFRPKFPPETHIAGNFKASELAMLEEEADYLSLGLSEMRSWHWLASLVLLLTGDIGLSNDGFRPPLPPLGCR